MPSSQGCKGCDRSDHYDNMVACDQCNGWWHFECAGVQASISERSWVCRSCNECRRSVRSGISADSNARLRLRQLEEAKSLEDRIQMAQADRDRAYLSLKHKLEVEIECDRAESSSVMSYGSCSSRQTSLHDWILEQNRSLGGRTNVETAIRTSTPIPSQATDQRKRQEPTVDKTKQFDQIQEQQEYERTDPSMEHRGLSHVADPPSMHSFRSQQNCFPPTPVRGQSNLLCSRIWDPTRSENRPDNVEILTPAPPRNPESIRPVHGVQKQVTLPPDQPLHIAEQEAGQGHPNVLRPVPLPRHTFEGETDRLRNLPPSAITRSNVPPIAPPRYTDKCELDNRHRNYSRPLVPPSGHSFVNEELYQHQYDSRPPGLARHFCDQQHVNEQQWNVTRPTVPPRVNFESQTQNQNINPPVYKSNPSQATPYGSNTWQQPVFQQRYPVQQRILHEPVEVISAQQLAARQVVPRELPKFSGDPLEWPMFLQAFETTTLLCGIQPDENLARLQKCLVGSAREKVQSILTLPAAVPNIIETLRDECGRPEQLVHCLLVKVRNAPHPNINKLDTLVTFGREVCNLVTYIEAARLENHLSNPMLLSELVAKLPPNLRLEWGLRTQRTGDVSLKAFSEYVSSIRTAACHVSLPSELIQFEDKKGKKKDMASYVNAHTAEEEARIKSSTDESKPKYEPKPCPACNRTEHKLRDCDKFRGSTVNEKHKLVEQHKLCKRCLVGHGKWPCRTKEPCGVNGCEEMHHKLLHSNIAVRNENEPGSSGLVSTHRNAQASTLFRILPVTLYGAEKTVTTFAFLDDGSSLTLLDKDLADELGLEGENSPLCLQWTGNVTRTETASRRVKLSISNVHDGPQYVMSDVRTVENLELPRQSLDYEQLTHHFPHLQNLPIESYSDAIPRILVGLDNAKLKLPLARRERRAEEPVATKTRLGWTIFGGKRTLNGPSCLMVHMCSCSQDDSLDDLVKGYFAVDNLGVEGLALESADDCRARKILQETTKRTPSGRFETGLIWRIDDIDFPDNYQMAEKRLRCLEKKLSKEPELKKKVDNLILEYMELGYAHKATEEELQNSDPKRIWYLPLGVVQNPRKPGKVRVVWDAAATVNGVSLNSFLLAGPDLLKPLLAVLCQFRQRQYAVSGDYRQMFHQFLIILADRQVQRFLYRFDRHSLPTVYILDVATFGATCSPCSAQYIKNLNASEFQDTHPEAAEAIVNNVYVDDYLDSKDTIDEAVKLALDVHTVSMKAGFELRNWQSNSEEILRRIGDAGNDGMKNFIAEKSTPTERVLGMAWITEEDIFVFSTQFREDLLHLMAGNVVPTKRQVLRVVMSYFDPLGIISNYTIHGRALLQDIWRSGVKWDDPIIEKDFVNWRRWVLLSPQLKNVSVPRCYFPNYDPNSYNSLQLHVFVDAGNIAYGGVAYFRIVDRGIPRCALVAAKAKVVPLKPMSTPRSELNAAVIGVRLMKMVEKNHTLSIVKRFLWTDSTTVLSWLHADPRNYRQYVALRVAEILTDSELNEWHWVGTSMNVADKVTKWGQGPDFAPDTEWYRGPDFLYLPENEWLYEEPDMVEPSEELKTVNVHHETLCESVVDFTEFSHLDRLLKRLAYLHHFRNNCCIKKRTPTATRIVHLTREDYDAAEKSLWKMVQAQAFPKELATLRRNATLPPEEHVRLEKSSCIAKSSPFIDDDGILRMQSRIDPEAAYYAFNFRNPIVLPKQGHVTELLVLRYHQKYAHANVETVVNELRQRYYIPKLRSTVKQIIKRCMWCRVYHAIPRAPKMAALPQPRVQPYVRPFTFVGIDYFGPIIIKRGRTHVKRWVALFTCLTVRAVHLEVVHSLSTGSCKMAIRRFIARRGSPQEIFSDNGTNFRGVAREMAEEIRVMNHEIANTFTNTDTKWNFNPPSAPHMGGVWERKVRSIKDAFKVLSHRDKLDDEEFVTFLLEAEMIVNSHPLTFVPLDEPNQKVLTPNDFLLMDSGGANNVARIPISDEVPLRANWKLMQDLLNQFWKRWIQAYLPTIARRTKWFTDVRPLQEGDLVVIVDEAVRNGWLRGRVIKAYSCADGQVRKVDVKTDSGILRRPAIKVALLDVQEISKTN